MKKTCSNCGDGFIGRSNASYCSPRCRLRAHRSRDGESGPKDETVTRSTATGAESALPTSAPVHSAEAVSLLESLAADLQNSDAAQDLPIGYQLGWSAQEHALIESIACTVDRHVDLWARYHASDDTTLRLKLSTELRLLEGTLASLLKQVKTERPAKPSRRSEKAKHAAEVRWTGASS